MKPVAGRDMWRDRGGHIKIDLYALYLAKGDLRVPWYAKALAVCVVAYAFSPIDLIPDFIPVLGYLDDLVLVPLGIALVLKMIPRPVLEDYRAKAEAALLEKRPRNWIAAGIIIFFWFLLVLAILRALKGAFM